MAEVGCPEATELGPADSFDSTKNSQLNFIRGVLRVAITRRKVPMVLSCELDCRRCTSSIVGSAGAMGRIGAAADWNTCGGYESGGCDDVDGVNCRWASKGC